MSKKIQPTLDKFFKPAPSKRPRDDVVVTPKVTPPAAVVKKEEAAVTHEWDDTHLKLPFSPSNTYTSHGKPRSVWAKVTAVMQTPILTPLSLLAAIKGMTGNSEMDVGALHIYLEALDDGVRGELFARVLPWMQRTLLGMPGLFPRPIPLLIAGSEGAVTMTCQQVACLIIAMFFCVMPQRSRLLRYQLESASSYAKSFPTLNMATLFGMLKSGRQLVPNQSAKLDCFLYYLTARCREEKKSEGCSIQIVRCCVASDKKPNWRESKAPLCDLEVLDDPSHVIENAHSTLQLDFAHKLIGGGVLGHGCVQEEIRFAVCPELLAARVVCEGMGAMEAVMVSGARQYSAYSGYGSTFRWSSPHDVTRRDVCVLAIDAQNFNTPNTSPDQQFYPYWCNREVNKAWVGFKGSETCVLAAGHAGPISTGNWGCGVFGGNLQLKALLQLCAASEVMRPVRYHTFGNAALAVGLRHVWATAKAKGLLVGDVYSALLTFQEASESHELMARAASSGLGEVVHDTDSCDTEDVTPSAAEAYDVFGHILKEMI